MSIYNYSILEVVVETQNFTRASERLHLTPSAISHAVAKIEAELGFPIFCRTREGVTLNENGKAILPYVQSVLRESESLSQKASSIAGIHEGTIRVGAFYAVTINWLVDIFADFHRRYPDIIIKLYEGGYKDVTGWIENNMVDLAIIADTVAGSLDFEPLCTDEAVCVVPMDFTPANASFVTEDDIENVPLIIQEDYEDVETKKILDISPKLSSNSNFVIEDDNCIMAMVEAGLGVAFMHELSTRKRFAKVKTYPFRPRVERTIGLYTAHADSISPATKEMRKTIIDYAKRP